MVMDNSGKVGIGTDSPSEKLEVAGNILLESTGSRTTVCKSQRRSLSRWKSHRLMLPQVMEV